MALCTVTGNIDTLTGGAVPTGSVTFLLIGFGNNMPRVLGSNIIAPLQTTIVTANDGSFSTSLQGNDTIDPAGTLYTVTITGTGLSQGPYLFNIGGVSVNLNTQPTANPSTPPVVPTGILGTNNTFTGTEAFNGQVSLNGGMTVGGGGLVSSVLKTSGVLTFPVINTQTGSEQTLAVSGALTTGLALASPLADLGSTSLAWSAWVSGSNTVSVRLVNAGTTNFTPNAVTWSVVVLQ